MKKWRLFIIALAIVVLALLGTSVVLFVRQSIVDNVKVFDLTNFICTVFFSVAALVLSVCEYRRNVKKDQELAEIEASNNNMKQSLSEMLSQKAEEITNIKQYYATSTIGDFPTYSNLPLNEMCDLIKSFHEDASAVDNKDNTKKKANKTTLSIAKEAIDNYVTAVEEVMGQVFKNGQHLSAASAELTVFICQSINDIRAKLTHFTELEGINYWTVMNINEVDIYGITETEKRKYLYNEACALCMCYNDLLETVLKNYKWFDILCNSIN